MRDHNLGTPETYEGIALGEEAAVYGLVARCQGRMVDLARALIKRHGVPAMYDAHDIANEVLFQLIKGASRRKKPHFETSDEFWDYARVLMVRRILDARDGADSLKRGGPGRNGQSAKGQVESAPARGVERVEAELDDLPSQRASHESVIDGAMEVEWLIEELDDPSLKRIARLKYEGFTLREIAKATKLDEATVKRKLQDIRAIWEKYDPNA
jgi:RNA polymerase sigma factor (sigma-70 family)